MAKAQIYAIRFIVHKFIVIDHLSSLFYIKTKYTIIHS